MQRYCGRTDLDVMVFGDTHSEWLEYVDGVLCVNPGSPTLPRNLATRLGTIGFLEIANGTPRAQHLAAHGARHRRVRLGALAPSGLTVSRKAYPQRAVSARRGGRGGVS